MISITGSLSFAKFVMMLSTPAKSLPRSIHSFIDSPIQSQLQTQLGVRTLNAISLGILIFGQTLIYVTIIKN